MDTLFFAALAFALLLLILAAFRGPTLWDRILAANLCSTLVAMGISLYSLVAGEIQYVDVAVIFVLLSFIGTQFYLVFISRFGKL